MNFKLLLILFISIFIISGCSSDFYEKPSEKDYVLIDYQPMQCQIEVWQKWLEESDIRFVKAPTDEEIIIMYYSNKYEVEILNVTKIEFEGVVCQACDVCPKGYSYSAKVRGKDLDIFLKENWIILDE